MIAAPRHALDGALSRASRVCAALALVLATFGCSSSDDDREGDASAGSDAGGGADGGTSGEGGGGAGNGGGDDGGSGSGGHAGTGGSSGHGGADAGPDASDGGTDETDAGGDASTQPKRCAGPLMITSDEQFAELLDERCRIVTGALRVTQTQDLTSLEGLVVERIEGDLIVAANESLRSLAGLERVTRVEGSLSIVNNAMLDSLEPLSDWAAGTVASTLSIFQNDSLPQCAVDALDAQLDATCDSCSGNDADGVCD